MANNISTVGIDCCGCGNCYHTCTKIAIEMRSDSEGFSVPAINDNCVDCGACLKVCPQLKPIDKVDGQTGYVAISKDKEILRYSASGGIFGTIAKNYLSQSDTFICAASFIDGKVRHIITQDIKDIRKCQGSKYVQSELNDCLPKIKELIKDAKNKILFCGTPCQVAALYSFIRCHPDNLVALDLVCHGVPSSKFLQKDVNHYCGNINKLDNLRFRWKHPNKARGGSGFILALEKERSYRLYSSSYDPYFASFMRGESFRESCYQCHYANLNRVGDITIGDCDSAKLFPDFHPRQGKSTVLINNSHGIDLWDRVKHLFDFADLDVEKEAKANHQLSYPFVRPSVRDAIYSDVYQLDFWSMKRKYADPQTKQRKILSFIQSYIPSLYKFIIERTL